MNKIFHKKILLNHLKSALNRIFKSKKQKILEEIRESWGKETIKKRDYSLISQYYKLKIKIEQNEFIDDKTWSDLDMDNIFEKTDRNISPIGRQYLYKMMRTYEKDQAILNERFKLYDLFKENPVLREEIQVILYKMNTDRGYYIPNLLFDKLPEKPRGYKLIYLFSLLFLIAFLFMFFIKEFLLVTIFFGITNILIRKNFDRKIYTHISSIYYLNKMFQTAVKLSGIVNDHKIPQLDSLKENKKLIEKLSKKLGWLLDDSEKFETVQGLAAAYLNTFCFAQLISFFKFMSYLEADQEKISEVYETIGQLDAYISVASFLTNLKVYSKPVFNDKNIIESGNLFHPLLQNPVPNSFYLKNNSVLITGSNMAGKTTFIKTIAINVILSRTLNICCAEKAVLPELYVKSLINREENLIEGKSYYFKEIELILEFIKMSSNEKKYLFVIDEILRGTNTVERVSAATSVLQFLGKNNVVLVTTHDVELQDLLKEVYVMYHFNEQIENNTIYFDYKIKEGPCLSRNAIKLLELKGYPESIIKNSLNLANKFSG